MFARTSRGRFFNLANNGLTIAGFVATNVSGLSIITFLIVNLLGGLHGSPYTGMFAFGVLPVFFVAGLILMPIGMLLRQRRLARLGTAAEEVDAYPTLNFNDPRLRRVATIVLFLTAVNMVILGSTSFLAVEHTETVAFCGETCHSVMQPEYTALKLKTCIADAGTAASVPIINTIFSVNDIPVAYMWCAQDEKLTIDNNTNAKIPEL